MKEIPILITLLSILLFGCANQNQTAHLHTKGVVLKVTDLEKAKDFYTNTIGFKVEKVLKNRIQLHSEGLELWLEKVDKSRKVKYDEETQSILTLQTNNLDSVMTAYTTKGVIFVREVRENGVGHSALFRDPFGNVISLLVQDKLDTPKFEEPKIYNLGYYLPDIQESMAFYCDKLGFLIRTENYLPNVLPLNHKDSAMAVILHNKGVGTTNVDFNSETQTNILFTTKSLACFKNLLDQNQIPWITTSHKNEIAIKDPWGNYSIIQESK